MGVNNQFQSVTGETGLNLGLGEATDILGCEDERNVFRHFCLKRREKKKKEITHILLKCRMMWAAYSARMGGTRNAYKVLVGKPERKRPILRPRHRRQDKIKIDLKGIGYDSMDWIYLAQGRVNFRAFVNTVMNTTVP
jgi:hypothetical protein